MESSMTADICFKLNRTNVTFTQNSKIKKKYVKLDVLN